MDIQPPLTDHWQGREEELRQISGWLQDAGVRLVGLRAVGGYGKSALAAKLCETVLGFAQILWVNFTQAHSFGLWAREVLRLLGAGDLEASLADQQVITFGVNYLSQRRYLVVMDNLETLLQPGGEWQDGAYEQFLLRWLERGRQTVLLLTSREQPQLPQERSYWKDLPGLTVAAGVALLESRGIRGERAELERFVRLADGHPLLLNLTVGWLKNPRKSAAPEVSYVLRQDDLYRFEQIVGLHRGDREASVGKVLAASLARLEARLRLLWQELSVYDRAFGLEAAQAMQPDVTLEELYRLVDRSLLQELPAQQFELLPLIQRFAQRQFAQQAEALTQAHEKAAVYYQQQCVPLEPQTPPVALAAYLGLFYHRCELGQYVDAWQLMQARTVADEQQGRYSSCEMFLRLQGSGSDRLKLRVLYERLVERWQPANRYEQNLFADVLQAIGEVLQFLKQSQEALSRYEAALQLYREVGSRLGEANTLQAIGEVLQFLNQRQEALSRYEAALQLYREVGSRLGEANTLSGLGNVYRALDRVDQALDCHQQALNIHRAIGARASEAQTLWGLGKDYDALEQYATAIEFYQQSLEIYRQIGARFSQAVVWQAIGDSRTKLSQISEARSAYQEARTFYLEIGMEESAQECQDALNELID
ncbi:MAG: tetratricopeptide repeat protein [Elainella sp. C42_A2020_010]|nr:tetratricopeptide repeat protein [Elainella sp. C42_A2020_010]